MDSAGDSASGAESRQAGVADKLPEPEPIDLQRLEARQEEAIEFEALINQVADGSEQALAALYDKASARIYGLLLRILRDPDEAAEVTQDVFVEVWRQAQRYDPYAGTVFSWMVAIAHQRGIACVSAAAEKAEPQPPAGDIRHQINEVWAVIEQRFSSARVRAGLRALDNAQRQALLLAYFEGYSQKQIAGLLDIPLHSVRVRMRDGLINLRRALGVSYD